MTYYSNILLGRISKVNSYDGTVTVKSEKGYFDDINEMESVFLEIEGKLVPFFIEETEYGGAEILRIKFKYYESSEKVNEFVGCNVFLASDISAEKDHDEITDLIGFSIFSQDNQLLGVITQIIPNRSQWLLQVTSPLKKEILIPLHEDFLVEIKKENRSVIMNIPDGLADLNI
jgi:16S rRNA processing protein RimM